MAKKLILILLLLVCGCNKPVSVGKEKPSYKVEQQMSPAMKEVVMGLLWMKSDPNIFKYREPDPFRKQ